jgi:phospholipid/cholesterol/gamma-HCH transport system substrate-binding protein
LGACEREIAPVLGAGALESRLPASHILRRVLATAALVVALAVVAVLLLGNRGGSYTVHARFQNASQLVNGNLVQVAGVPVGKIQSIDLTPDGQADVRMKITDAGYRPLRRGTKAIVRQASLSGVANRYVDLQLPDGAHQATIPSGGVIDQSDTTTAVDLDQLFNTFDPKTRKALSGVIRGYAASYEGRGAEANAGWAYLNPALAASSRLFKALDADTPALKRFITESSNLVGDLATRRSDLAGLVDHLATTTGAIGRQKQALSIAIGELPGFMRRADTTFVNLRATLDDLEPLVDESKPVAKKLRPFLAELRPLARDARPTLRDLSALVRSPGASNDLIELTKSSVPLRTAAVGPTKRNGKERDGAFPGSAKALKQAIPELATARPYAPDLTGWFDDFSHSGLYDALGGASRAAPYVNLFAPVNGVLKPLLEPALQSEAFKDATSLDQRWRCPGSVERGAAWKPSADFPCDASEEPLGP